MRENSMMKCACIETYWKSNICWQVVMTLHDSEYYISIIVNAMGYGISNFIRD